MRRPTCYEQFIAFTAVAICVLVGLGAILVHANAGVHCIGPTSGGGAALSCPPNGCYPFVTCKERSYSGTGHPFATKYFACGCLGAGGPPACCHLRQYYIDDPEFGIVRDVPSPGGSCPPCETTGACLVCEVNGEYHAGCLNNGC